MMGDFLPILREFGPLVVAVIFFIWRDARREDRQQTRIDALEDEFRNVVIPLTKAVTGALVRNTEVMEENIKVMRDVEKVLT